MIMDCNQIRADANGVHTERNGRFPAIIEQTTVLMTWNEGKILYHPLVIMQHFIEGETIASRHGASWMLAKCEKQ
jgi:hypothetical protein